jgi:hypothetical protein
VLMTLLMQWDAKMDAKADPSLVQELYCSIMYDIVLFIYDWPFLKFLSAMPNAELNI